MANTSFQTKLCILSFIYYDTDSREKQLEPHRIYIKFRKGPIKRKKRKAEAFLCVPLCLLQLKLLSLGSHDLTTIVGTASLAGSVGHNGFAALGANAHAGSGQLPVGTTTLVATGAGHFTLRDSHG